MWLRISGRFLAMASTVLLLHPVQPGDHLHGSSLDPVPLSPLGQLVEVLPVPGFATYQHLVPLEAVVGLEPLAAAIAHRDMPTMMTTLVLV